MKGFQIALTLLTLALSGLSFAVESSPEPAPASAEASATMPDRVNLNTADVDQLQSLKGVGPKTAESIIQWRDANGPFTSGEQLLVVKGVGEKTLAGLRDSITVQ